MGGGNPIITGGVGGGSLGQAGLLPEAGTSDIVFWLALLVAMCAHIYSSRKQKQNSMLAFVSLTLYSLLPKRK